MVGYDPKMTGSYLLLKETARQFEARVSAQGSHAGLLVGSSLTVKVNFLIARLGSMDFDTREEATAELTKLAPFALPELQAALQSDDLEVARRAQQVLNNYLPAARLRMSAPAFMGLGGFRGDILQYFKQTPGATPEEFKPFIPAM